MKQRLLLVALIALTIAGATAIKASGAEPTVPPRAILFGDSITYQARPYYEQMFSPKTPTTYIANPGWAMKDHLADWRGWINALAAQPADTPVVLALGGNDAIQHGATLAARYDPLPYWKRALDALTRSGRCVVVPDLERGHQSFTAPYQAERQALWSRLRPLLDSYPTVHIVPWQQYTVTRADWYAPDKLHHTAPADKAYAWAIWLGLQECYK